MENEKNIGKATRPEPRSVLLIDGRGEGDAPIGSWEDLLDIAYSKIAPIDDGLQDIDIDTFGDCFDIHEGVAFPVIDLCDSMAGKNYDVVILIESWRIDELSDTDSEAVLEYCAAHGIPTDAE